MIICSTYIAGSLVMQASPDGSASTPLPMVVLTRLKDAEATLLFSIFDDESPSSEAGTAFDTNNGPDLRFFGSKNVFSGADLAGFFSFASWGNMLCRREKDSDNLGPRPGSKSPEMRGPSTKTNAPKSNSPDLFLKLKVILFHEE